MEGGHINRLAGRPPDAWGVRYGIVCFNCRTVFGVDAVTCRRPLDRGFFNAKYMQVSCPKCGRVITSDGPGTVPDGGRVMWARQAPLWREGPVGEETCGSPFPL